MKPQDHTVRSHRDDGRGGHHCPRRGRPRQGADGTPSTAGCSRARRSEELCLLRPPLRRRASGAASEAEGRRDEASGHGGARSAGQEQQLFLPPRRAVSPPAPAISTPAAIATTLSPRMPARTSASIAASIARAAASTWPCRKTTRPRSSGLSTSWSGIANKPDDEARDALSAGADDKVFRVDRTETSDCAELVTDRKELAAIRHK